MFKKKISGRKILEILRSFIWFLGLRAFLSFIILTLVTFFITAVIFYLYVYLPLNQEPEVKVPQTGIDENLYEEFLDNYTKRKENFSSAGSKEFSNPFYRQP